MRGDRDEIKQGLKDRIDDLCRRLLPDGRREGRLWVSHNPATGDAATHPKDPTFKVAMDRDVGAWTDWRSGEKGDVFGLISYLVGSDFVGTLEWSRDFLGLRAMTRQERTDYSRRQAEARARAAAEAERKATARASAVARLWDATTPLLGDTAAAAIARRYLAEGRGVPIESVPNLDAATFRVSASLEWWKGARRGRDRRKTEPGPSFPALVCAFRSATGLVTGVHCTFLDPDAPRKAPVDAPKLMFGDSKGSVIAISTGPEGVAHELAVEPHPLIVGEGVEDGVTLAIGVPEARVWSAGALLQMGHVPAGLPCVSAVMLAADNDWKSAQARAQLDQVLDELQRHQKPVELMRSAVGKDFNDGMKE